MSYFPAHQGYIGISSQGIQKTTPQNPKIFVKFLSDAMAPNYNEEILVEGGNGIYEKQAIKTLHEEKVGFSAYARPNMVSYILGHFMGKDTVTPGAVTTPALHTFTIKTTDLATTPRQKWLTVERKFTQVTSAHRVVGVKMSALTFEMEAGKPVKMTVEGTGLTAVLRTSVTTDTYETNSPFSFYHGTYKIPFTTTNFDIKGATVKLISQNDEQIQTVGLTRRDIINLKWRVEVDVKGLWTNWNIYKKSIYGNTTAPTEVYSEGALNLAMTYGTGVARRGFEIAIPRINLKPSNVTMDPGAKTMEQNFSGYALKPATTTNMITCKVYNVQTTTCPF